MLAILHATIHHSLNVFVLQINITIPLLVPWNTSPWQQKPSPGMVRVVRVNCPVNKDQFARSATNSDLLETRRMLLYELGSRLGLTLMVPVLNSFYSVPASFLFVCDEDVMGRLVLSWLVGLICGRVSFVLIANSPSARWHDNLLKHQTAWQRKHCRSLR